jgi:hypothetical protein
MGSIELQEVQRFRVWWAWLGVIGLNLLFIYAIIQQVFMGKPFGSKPASNITLILIEVGPLLLVFFLASIKLKTRIDDRGIHYRYFPFQFRTLHIEWHELRDAYMRQYNSFHEYGGWGIRIGSPKTGNAINTSESSDKGLQLQFNDGRLLLIGTKHPDDMQKLLDDVFAAGLIHRNV